MNKLTRNIRLFSILFVVLAYVTNDVCAQDSLGDSTKVELKKNLIYGTFGTVVYLGAINVNYERLLFSDKNEQLHLLGKIGYGILYEAFQGSLLYGNANITLIHGRNSKFFEFSIGYMYRYDSESRKRSYYTDDFSNHFINGSVGYRYQKPDGKFIFRGGAGYPETLYISLGFCFGR